MLHGVKEILKFAFLGKQFLEKMRSVKRSILKVSFLKHIVGKENSIVKLFRTHLGDRITVAKKEIQKCIKGRKDESNGGNKLNLYSNTLHLNVLQSTRPNCTMHHFSPSGCTQGPVSSFLIPTNVLVGALFQCELTIAYLAAMRVQIYQYTHMDI